MCRRASRGLRSQAGAAERQGGEGVSCLRWLDQRLARNEVCAGRRGRRSAREGQGWQGRGRAARATPRPWHSTTAQPIRSKADKVDPPRAIATADTVIRKHLLLQCPSVMFNFSQLFWGRALYLEVSFRGLELQAQQDMQFLVEGPKCMHEGGRLQLRSRSTGAAPDLNYRGLSQFGCSGLWQLCSGFFRHPNSVETCGVSRFLHSGFKPRVSCLQC